MRQWRQENLNEQAASQAKRAIFTACYGSQTLCQLVLIVLPSIGKGSKYA